MADIYYVEDDENISQTVKEFLEQRGYHVDIFASIEAAKRGFQRACPTLALVDWNMPVMWNSSGRYYA